MNRQKEKKYIKNQIPHLVFPDLEHFYLPKMQDCIFGQPNHDLLLKSDCQKEHFRKPMVFLSILVKLGQKFKRINLLKVGCINPR